MIKPCTTLFVESGNEVPGIFHLLSCGHIVAVDDDDKRCGCSCQHAVTWAATHALTSKIGKKTSLTVKSYLPHLSITQADDTLYCETCTGIPIDRWQRKHPSQRSKTLRPSLALIRPVIQSAFGVDVVQAGAAPCQLYFNPKCEGFEWNQEHRLRCGHEIWNALG